MTISANKVITLNYTLTDNESNIIDKSDDGSFVYIHGAQNIIPGLENALEGKLVGDTLQVSIEPKDGYGERNDAMLETVPKAMFGELDIIEPGMQFHAQSPEGQMVVVTVVAVEGDQVSIDGNHPLAGVNLNFDVEIIDIREASAEELEHGHVHGPSCNHDEEGDDH